MSKKKAPAKPRKAKLKPLVASMVMRGKLAKVRRNMVTTIIL